MTIYLLLICYILLNVDLIILKYYNLPYLILCDSNETVHIWNKLKLNVISTLSINTILCVLKRVKHHIYEGLYLVFSSIS